VFKMAWGDRAPAREVAFARPLRALHCNQSLLGEEPELAFASCFGLRPGLRATSASLPPIASCERQLAKSEL